jgi:hypothetical protein
MSTCGWCNGTGYAPAKTNSGSSNYEKCSRCQGDGFLTALPGRPYAYRRALATESCPNCHGTGYAHVTMCSFCGGKGWIKQTYSSSLASSDDRSTSGCLWALLWFWLVGPGSLFLLFGLASLAGPNSLIYNIPSWVIYVPWFVFWLGGTAFFLYKVWKRSRA